ncbi:MAG: hypothetical protein V1697_01800 [Candidatus Levyibacteriota bacterium]
MKKIILIISILVIFILDWVALDDITTGNQPNFSGEYLFLALSTPVLIFAIYLLLKRKKKS